MSILLLAAVGCRSDDSFPNYTPGFTVVADASDGIDRPQDLEFHPFDDRRAELWVVNRGTEDTGSDMVIVHDAGTDAQASEQRVDGNAWHFMNLTTAIAFSDNGNWASSPEVTDANHAGGTFTGPSLWSSDLDVFGLPSGGNGSHLDMLHQSPNAMGIAHEVDNVFWVFDGYANELVRYDFASDHGPGNDDHGDGRVRRYSSLPIERMPDTPAHMVLDDATGWLYVCDPQNGQVLRVDVTSGSRQGPLPQTNEPLAALVQWEGEVWEVFADVGLDTPSGVALHEGILYVGDAETAQIVGFDVTTGEDLGRIETGAGKLLGLEVDPDGNLWFVDRRSDTVTRVDRL
jgi:hypothetical protein